MASSTGRGTKSQKRTKRKKDYVVQFIDGRWYPLGMLGFFNKDECCDCGLVHSIKYRLRGGVIAISVKRQERETAEVRKKNGIVLEKKQ